MSLLSRSWAATLALLLPLLCVSAVETQLMVNATDDGLPAGSSLSYTWTVTSFPAGATGANAAQILGTPSSGIPGATAQNPRVVLSVAGTYVFHVAVSDGHLTTQGTALQDLTIVVNPAPKVPPTISAIPDQRIAKGSDTGILRFTVGDTSDATGIKVSYTSSNTALVPDSTNVWFGGSGKDRQMAVYPLKHLSGTTTMTITVTDSGGLTAKETFLLTVNAPPVITTVSAAQTTLTLP